MTWQEVRADMQAALNHAYTDPNRNILNVVRQNEVEKQGEIPTPEEFIKYAQAKVVKTVKEEKTNFSSVEEKLARP